MTTIWHFDNGMAVIKSELLKFSPDVQYASYI